MRAPTGTLCRCGHLLECCADCRGWLVANSPRIANAWAWTINHPRVHIDFGGEAAELNDLGVYMARRLLNG